MEYNKSLEKRNFLKTSFAMVGGLYLPSSMAQNADYSKKDGDYDLYKRNYNYNPASRETFGIKNEILPQNNIRNFWDNPRRIYLQRQATGEKAVLTYFENGQVNSQHYWFASYLLRDLKAKKMIFLDIKLLDLLCAVQAWLIHYGVTSPIIITSGFRSWETNTNIEGAAKNSMHMYGKAVDFTVPGVNPRILANIAAQFKAGGIGIYMNRNFIHLDTGGVRIWSK